MGLRARAVLFPIAGGIKDELSHLSVHSSLPALSVYAFVVADVMSWRVSVAGDDLLEAGALWVCATLHTCVWSKNECVCVHGHTCACAGLVYKPVCPVGLYKRKPGTNNSSFGNLPCRCGSQAGEKKLQLGRADFVAWLHVRVSTWVCFN